ncbi:DgyrCDS7622 [Dimorphilus gyrociliatus]|uniref:DgyrCDS7622 n=1 Tax=Dimorphilus gyrociliatus TaxID=2664684 RepID=A0A7I8VRJ3_9ANNE|nr:DgyrCDS7622 [Dimorphilus gyrociliatus]
MPNRLKRLHNVVQVLDKFRVKFKKMSNFVYFNPSTSEKDYVLSEIIKLILQSDELPPSNECLQWYTQSKDNENESDRILGQETKYFTSSSYDKLTNKIIDNLLNHNFDDVLSNLLKQITLPTNSQYARHGFSFFRLALECFRRKGEESLSDMSELIKLLVRWTIVSREHVIIEYARMLEQYGEYEQAQASFIKTKKSGLKKASQWEKELETLYLGQKAVSEYLLAINRYSSKVVMENSTEDFEPPNKKRRKNDTNKIVQSTILSKVLPYFVRILDMPSANYDFYTKLSVEIKCNNGQLEDAIKLLKAYSLKNPRNPTPFRELYSLYLKDLGDVKPAIEYLEKFCQLCPSDDLCIELCEMQMRHEYSSLICINVLMKYLEYPCNTDKRKAWKFLAALLLDIMDKFVNLI